MHQETVIPAWRKTPFIGMITLNRKSHHCQAQSRFASLAGFTVVRFLLFYILANRAPNHWATRISKSEYLRGKMKLFMKENIEGKKYNSNTQFEN